jgi:hypothetical protein
MDGIVDRLNRFSEGGDCDKQEEERTEGPQTQRNPQRDRMVL